MATITPDLKQKLNDDPNSPISVQEDKGIVVIKVVPDSPAAKAGLKAGDVITKIGGQDAASAEVIQQKLLKRVKLEEIWRSSCVVKGKP